MKTPNLGEASPQFISRDQYEIDTMTKEGGVIEELGENINNRTLIILSHKKVDGFVVPKWQLSDQIRQNMPGLIQLLSSQGNEINSWEIYDFFENPRVILLGLSPKEVLLGKRDVTSENPNFNIDEARIQLPDLYETIDRFLNNSFEMRLQAVKDAIEESQSEP